MEPLSLLHWNKVKAQFSSQMQLPSWLDDSITMDSTVRHRVNSGFPCGGVVRRQDVSTVPWNTQLLDPLIKHHSSSTPSLEAWFLCETKLPTKIKKIQWYDPSCPYSLICNLTELISHCTTFSNNECKCVDWLLLLSWKNVDGNSFPAAHGCCCCWIVAFMYQGCQLEDIVNFPRRCPCSLVHNRRRLFLQ